MIRCWCCENRVGNSIDACQCSAGYHTCGHCTTHCNCNPKQHAASGTAPVEEQPTVVVLDRETRSH